MASRIKDKSVVIMSLFAIGIILVALISIATDYFDIPSLLFNTSPTPFNWQGAIIEVLLAFAIGLSVGLYLLRLLSRQKQVEEALLDSEEKYRQVVSNVGEAIAVVQNELVKFANPRATELFGYSGDKLYARRLVELVYPDDREIVNKLHLATLKDEELSPACRVYRIIGKGGDIKWIEATVTKIMWEREPAVLAFLADITDHKRMEDVLKQSEERYRTILDDVEKGYCEADLAGNITFVNDSVCNILGYTSEEIIGTNYRGYAGKNNATKIYKDTNSVYIAGKPARWFSWELLTKSGEARVVEVSITPKFNTHGEVIGFRGIFNDVTEREANEQRVLMTSKLASIGELASGVAHELNNPLTSVMGYAQLLVDSKNVPPEVESDLNRIYQESQRATKIVQNLLSFARPRKPEKIYFDANELVQRTLDLRSYELKTTNIRVNVELEPDLPEIKADYHQIQQVILNILINAEQALTEIRRRGKITIATNVVGDHIRISIGDNGPGISKENISRIFDPFFTTKEVGKGTGLGLSVCHGIVTAHGGNICVASEKGKGASFVVDLPIAVAGELGSDVEVVVVEDSPGRRRKASGNILIVDDEMGIRDILARVLSGMGYRTDSASDAESALTKLAKNDYDLCIIDLKLTRISGRRLYEIMKERYSPLAEKVMFITGDTVTPSTQSFLDSTGRPYLTKPFNPKAAVEFVEKILEGKSSRKVS
jgi:two-component system NtrC family sensor kinase